MKKFLFIFIFAFSITASFAQEKGKDPGCKVDASGYAYCPNVDEVSDITSIKTGPGALYNVDFNNPKPTQETKTEKTKEFSNIVENNDGIVQVKRTNDVQKRSVSVKGNCSSSNSMAKTCLGVEIDGISESNDNLMKLLGAVNFFNSKKSILGLNKKECNSCFGKYEKIYKNSIKKGESPLDNEEMLKALQDKVKKRKLKTT